MITFTRLIFRFIIVVLPLHQLNAAIISGYRIKIDGLGTLILLGDRHERTINDLDQYDTLRSFLKVVAQQPGRALLNLETVAETQAFYHRLDEDTLKERQEATKVITKLRILMDNLKEEEGLKDAIHFETSDPRNSYVWDIFLKSLLQDSVRRSLESNGEFLYKRDLLSSFEKDNQTILDRYARFLERASRELPDTLYQAAKKILNEKIESALIAKKALTEFFNRYASGNPLNNTSILKIIYNYARSQYPGLVESFSTLPAAEQKQIIDMVTRSFAHTIDPFSEQYYAIVNLPWIIDSLNAFMTPRSAKLGVFYAGHWHVRAIVKFMQQIQAELSDGGTINFMSMKVNDKVNDLAKLPLSREDLETVLDLAPEIKKMKLRKEIQRLERENEKMKEMRREAKKNKELELSKK